MDDLSIEATLPDEGKTKTSSRVRLTGLMRAHVALLEEEMIRPQQGDLFSVVQRYYEELRYWHSQHTGWYLERRGNVFRLQRTPVLLLPAQEKNTKLPEPRDFACLALILSFAATRQMEGAGNEQQFLLSTLTTFLVEHARDEQGEPLLDLKRRADRYSLMHALKYLDAVGGLQLVEGQSQGWIDYDHEMLYEFTPITTLMITSFDFKAFEAAEESLRTFEPLGPAMLEPDLPPLRRVWRALLLGPVLLRYDDPQGFTVLLEQADLFEQTLMKTFGWQLELNRDYACVVRSSGTAADANALLTPGSSIDQIVLLLCRACREGVSTGRFDPDLYGCLHLHAADLENMLSTEIRPQFGSNWSKENQDSSVSTLMQSAYQKMRLAGLLRGPDANGDLLVLPLAARFAPVYIGRGEGGASARPKKSRQKSKAVEETGLWAESK